MFAFLLEALLPRPLAPLPGSLSSSSRTADATEDNALTLSFSVCSITREHPVDSCHCWVLTIVFMKMDRYWSQILFLETRVKKFCKREVLEQNLEAEVSERHFILIYFIISLPAQSVLDVIADTGTLGCLRWLQKERQKQASNLSH